MSTSRLARPWHTVTLVAAAVALVLQLVLILQGQTTVDGVVASTGAEAVRRYFSYFTIQSNLLVAVSTFLIVTGRSDGRAFSVVRLASLVASPSPVWWPLSRSPRRRATRRPTCCATGCCTSPCRC